MSTYVNADLIAAGLSSFQPEAAAFQAGRIMLAQMNALVRKRATFAFETTLATRGYARWLRGCRVQGYRVGLLFLSLPDSEAGVERVSRSVQSGGHAILEDVVRRRFSRGLHNFYNLYLPLLDRWFFADNLGSTPRPLPHGGLGLSTVEQDPLFEELRNRYGAV
jgi:predicted ABC-type ATPase